MYFYDNQNIVSNPKLYLKLVLFVQHTEFLPMRSLSD